MGACVRACVDGYVGGWVGWGAAFTLPTDGGQRRLRHRARPAKTESVARERRGEGGKRAGISRPGCGADRRRRAGGGGGVSGRIGESVAVIVGGWASEGKQVSRNQVQWKWRGLREGVGCLQPEGRTAAENGCQILKMRRREHKRISLTP